MLVAVVLMFVALPATAVTLASLLATVVTFEDIPATVVMLLEMSAQVSKSDTIAVVPKVFISATASAVPSLPISVALPATVVTLDDIPATVVTFELFPATVLILDEFNLKQHWDILNSFCPSHGSRFEPQPYHHL